MSLWPVIIFITNNFIIDPSHACPPIAYRLDIVAGLAGLWSAGVTYRVEEVQVLLGGGVGSQHGVLGVASLLCLQAEYDLQDHGKTGQWKCRWKQRKISVWIIKNKSCRGKRSGIILSFSGHFTLLDLTWSASYNLFGESDPESLDQELNRNCPPPPPPGSFSRIKKESRNTRSINPSLGINYIVKTPN